MKAVTAFLSMPSCASRVVRVEAIIAKGKPELIPRNKAASGARSKYGVIAAMMPDCPTAVPSSRDALFMARE